MNKEQFPDVKHYNKYKIQPIEFIVANDIDFLVGNVIKYVCRYDTKNGLDDLNKAKIYLNWLIEREEKKVKEVPNYTEYIISDTNQQEQFNELVKEELKDKTSYQKQKDMTNQLKANDWNKSMKNDKKIQFLSPILKKKYTETVVEKRY